jgi:hypothetical protein
MGRASVNALLCALLLSGCAEFPSLPDETALPVAEVLEHTTCELRAALQSDWLAKYPKFHPGQWSVGISLNPVIDTDFNLNAGAGLKTNDNPPITHLFSWVLGPGTGLQDDLRGHNEATTGYVLSSADLLKTKSLEVCETMEHDASLAHHIGIEEWLKQSMPRGVIGPDVATTNKLTFNTWVQFKFNGTGAGVTWTVPRGSAYGSIGGYYQAQYILGLQFTPTTPPPPIVVTLPDDSYSKPQNIAELKKAATFVQRPAGSVGGVSADDQTRLNLLQLEQSIKNIRIQQ